VHPDVVVCDTAAIPIGGIDVATVDADLTDPVTGGHDPVRLARTLADLLG
jgi:hypothetical protein